MRRMYLCVWVVGRYESVHVMCKGCRESSFFCVLNNHTHEAATKGGSEKNNVIDTYTISFCNHARGNAPFRKPLADSSIDVQLAVCEARCTVEAAKSKDRMTIDFLVSLVATVRPIQEVASGLQKAVSSPSEFF